MMKRNLLTMALAIYSLLGVAQVPTYVPTDGLVGYWPFNGNANDESNNANDGVVNGASLSEDKFGNANSAYYFNGTSSIICPQNNIPTDVFSLSVWMKQETSFSSLQFVCLGSSSSTSWGTVASSESIFVGYGAGCGATGEDFTVSSSLPLNAWKHVVYVSQGLNSTTLVYVDGQFVGESDNSNSIGNCSTGNLYFGVDIFSQSEYIVGNLDDIGIWNRELIEEEIQALYNGCNVLPTTIAGSLSPFTLTSSDYACNNNSGSTYEWIVSNGVITAGQGTSNVTVLWGSEGLGTLTVVETNAEGCTGAPASINVDVVCATTASIIDGPLGPNALTETTYTCNGVEGSTYQWTISNGVITSGQGTNSVTVLWAGTGLGSISVQETTNANCTGDVISIDVVVIPTSINEVEENAMILYYPNPTSNSLTMEFGNNILSFGYSVRITNSIGQTIHSTNVTNSTQVIDVSTWSSGTYFISVLNDTGTEVQTKSLIIL